MSVYNGAKYLREAVESILNQTFSDFEFIIINDGSTDDTEKIIAEFGDKRIVRLKNEKNIGLVKSLNLGLKIARGEFIARMDADDISNPERFEKQIKYFERHPETGVLGTNINHIDSRENFIAVLEQPATHYPIFWKMLFDCAIIHPTVMMKRDVVMETGGYDPRFIHTEDTELWSRLIFSTRFANLQEILHSRRLHGKSIMNTQSKTQYHFSVKIRKQLFEKLLEREVPEATAEWFSRLGKSLTNNQIKEIISILLELYGKFIKKNDIDGQTEITLREDLAFRIMLISQSNRKLLLKKTIWHLKKVIPASLRHKLKTSTIGKYLTG